MSARTTKWFLPGLYNYSKSGFAACILFLVGYAVLFSKKMDTTLTPYNNMFAGPYRDSSKAHAYSVKVNGQRIPITDFFYWKKDFLESSLHSFSMMRLHKESYMETFLRQHNPPEWLTRSLTPDRQNLQHWPSWYLGFAGFKTFPGDFIEIIRYDMSFSERGVPFVTDSLQILQTTAH